MLDLLFAVFSLLPAAAVMSGAGDNYEAVDMEESDGSGSDNEAFASKQEYKAYKEQFNVSKVGERLELRLNRETIGRFYRVKQVGPEEVPRLKMSMGVVVVPSMVEEDPYRV